MNERIELNEEAVTTITVASAICSVILGIAGMFCYSSVNSTNGQQALIAKAIQAGKSPLEAKCASMSSPGEDKACLLVAAAGVGAQQ
ncbi:hypothetical protein [Methylovulum miyakonense]|uniref:hypothetical protein n=1 Tax=Methylovulum miyakonense TaxID=645578 RepID=UPI0003752FDD|nr:hypothetical protein [Methylovulum miyakonense]